MKRNPLKLTASEAARIVIARYRAWIATGRGGYCKRLL